MFWSKKLKRIYLCFGLRTKVKGFLYVLVVRALGFSRTLLPRSMMGPSRTILPWVMVSPSRTLLPRIMMGPSHTFPPRVMAGPS